MNLFLSQNTYVELEFREYGGIFLYKRIFILAISVSLCFAMKAYAVEDVSLDSEASGQTTLFGNVGEKQIYSLDNIVESRKSASANIDVITLKDIQEQGSPMLSDLMNQLGSVTVQRSGSDGDITSFRIRGTDRVRVTIDGMRADSPVDNKFYLNNYLSDDFERIEVIKGPQGNVGGVNSSGGLVSMQTRRGHGKPSVEMESGAGNLGTFRERFAFMGGDDIKDYYFSVNYFKTDGGMRINNNLANVQNDQYNTLNVVSNLGRRFLDGKAEIRDTMRFSNSNKNVGVNGFGTTIQQDPNDYSRNMDFFNTLAFNYMPVDWYNSSTKFGLFSTVNNFFQRPDDFDMCYGSDRFRSTRMSLISQHNFQYKDWNTFSVGYNLESNTASSISDYSQDPFWPSYSKFNGSTLQNDVYVNDVINIKDKLFIRGGTRLSNNSEFGTYVLPNISAALVLPTYKVEGATTKFRASWGQSVNNPSLYQRFGMIQGMLDPNPNLTAEKLDGMDVGVEQTFFNDKVSLDFGYFSNQYKDYIGWQTDPNTWVGTYVNVNEAKISGYEASLKWTPNHKFRTVLNYTFSKSEDLTTGYELPGVPQNRLNASVFYTPTERLTAFARAEFSSDRVYSGNNKVDGYTDVAMGATVRLFSIKYVHVYLKAQIYNLLNQKMAMYQNYYQPGLHYMIGIFMKINSPSETL